MRRLSFVALLLCAATTIFAGTVVYNNGAPNQGSGNEMTNWIQAEDFTLGQTTTITDVHFWTIELPNPSGYAGSIWYGIYTDNGGQPNLGAPAVEGFLSGADLTRTSTGNIVQGSYDEYAYSFDIQPFVALAGQTYWLGLHNGDLTNDARAEVYWETTGINGTSTGHEDILPTAGDSWSDNGQEHAFQLTGGGVPEPTTLILFGAGLAGLALVRRRRA